MLTRGYAGTSIEDICGTAAVTKGSFFHYFASKEILAKLLIVQFAERQAALLFAAAGSIGDPVDRVLSVVDAMIGLSQNPDGKGCLVGTIAQETAESHPELREVCAACFAGMVEKLQGMFAEARASEPRAARFDPKELADYLLSLGQGSLLVCKATGDRLVFTRNLRQFRSYLEHLLGRD